jgi:anti-sigma regulatory factor (Ser/Thr protein kinase)
VSDRHEVEIRILSKPDHLCIVRQALCAALSKYGYGEGETGQISLAVDEALANVIRHGYEGREDQPIWIKFGRVLDNGTARLEIVVEDQARQIDPSQIAGRDLTDVRPGGLGVHIMNEIMDHVAFTPREGGGMRLVMTKSAAAPQDDASAPPPPECNHE